MNSLTAIDLFCGAGGLGLGLMRAGFRVKAAVDTDRFSRETYSHNHPETMVWGQDVGSLGNIFGAWDLVAGGPPCQPFSVAGPQTGVGDRRDGTVAFTQVVEQVRPRIFLMENVAALAGARHEAHFDTILNHLVNLNYDVTYEILDAADYGVPQHRRRLFVIGFRNDGGNKLLKNMRFAWPEPTHGPGRLSYVTVRQALASIASLSMARNSSKVTYAKSPVLRPQLGDSLIVNGRGRVLSVDHPSRTITAAGGNSVHILDTTPYLGWLECYHKTLLAGCGEVLFGEVGHDVRRLTIEEAAALQGFPPDYRFSGPVSSRFRQVGNAVPPPLAEAIGRSIRAALEEA